MSAEREHHWATLWEAVADAVPDAAALVQGDVRRSWAAFDDRAARLAGALRAAGIGEGAKVAQYCYNAPEYAETYFAALKVRAIPVNVNYRYRADELCYILDNSDAEALVYHASLGDHVDAIRMRAHNVKVFVEVDDAPQSHVAGAARYEELIAAHEPAVRIARSSRDPVMTYTGGTTGMPKGVVGRIGGGVAGLLVGIPPLLGSDPVTDAAGVAALARRFHDDGRQLVTLPACPLMHGTGLVIGMQTGLLFGGRMALLRGRHFDACELWDLVEQERVNLVAVVGDPFARPMLHELERVGRPRDLECVRFISSSGAMFSREVKEGLLARLPEATILDYISSTEGLMGASVARAGHVPATGSFRPMPGVRVLDEDDRDVAAGSGAAGLVALSVGVPDAYYKDDTKTDATFRAVDGTRYSFPGDWATVQTDGSITLVGRGSQCINTGGEKVFPEEVEETLKRHDAVDDCLVFGVPDERFGQQRRRDRLGARTRCSGRRHRGRQCVARRLQAAAGIEMGRRRAAFAFRQGRLCRRAQALRARRRVVRRHT